jgi:hypothetical protein
MGPWSIVFWQFFKGWTTFSKNIFVIASSILLLLHTSPITLYGLLSQMYYFWILCLCRYKLSHVKPSAKSLAVSQKVSIRTDDRGLLCFQYMIPADNHTCFIEYCVSTCYKPSVSVVCSINYIWVGQEENIIELRTFTVKVWNFIQNVLVFYIYCLVRTCML